MTWENPPANPSPSDDEHTVLRDPTKEEIEKWVPPTDIDLKKWREILDRIRNLTWEERNRLLIKAVRAKILDQIVDPTRMTMTGVARTPETRYAGRLRVPEVHLWDPMKSIGQYGTYHPGTQFGATRYRHPTRFTRDVEPSGSFSVFWDVSGSNNTSNDRYGGKGRLLSGMETIICILIEARLRGDLVSLYVTPNMDSEGRVLDPIEICGQTAYAGFAASQYFFKSNDYDAIESCVYGTDTRGYEDYKGTVPFMIRDFYIGEKSKRGMSIFIADAGDLGPINEVSGLSGKEYYPWLRELYKVSEIVYLHITDLSEGEWKDKSMREGIEKKIFTDKKGKGITGEEYFAMVQGKTVIDGVEHPGIVYRNVGDGSHLSEIALDEIAKLLGGSKFKEAGGSIKPNRRYASR